MHVTAPNNSRMGLGTANVYYEDLQTFFSGDQDSFQLQDRLKSNASNQIIMVTIEELRMSLRINFFCDMIDSSIFLPANIFHQAALLYSFLPVNTGQIV